MGWLRSNWLDALIFLLVAAIMAGVIFFLTGVNPLSAFGGGRQTLPPSSVTKTPTPQTTPPTTPAQPKPTPQPARPQTQTPQPEPEPVVTVLPVPSAPVETNKPDSKPVPAPPKIKDNPTPSQQAQTQPQPTVQVSPAPDLSGSYRVTVGSFKDVANAQRLIETLKKQGYPARTDPAGEVTRVWVGPYSLSKARAIADALGQYQPQVTRIAGPATTAQPQTPTAQPPAPTSTAKYLQVGAFRSAASAQAVVEKVREAGYPVVLVEGGGLVRVRVGPLDNPSEAAAALRAKGLDVLEVR